MRVRCVERAEEERFEESLMNATSRFKTVGGAAEQELMIVVEPALGFEKRKEEAA